MPFRSLDTFPSGALDRAARCRLAMASLHASPELVVVVDSARQPSLKGNVALHLTVAAGLFSGRCQVSPARPLVNADELVHQTSPVVIVSPASSEVGEHENEDGSNFLVGVRGVVGAELICDVADAQPANPCAQRPFGPLS